MCAPPSHGRAPRERLPVPCVWGTHHGKLCLQTVQGLQEVFKRARIHRLRAEAFSLAVKASNPRSLKIRSEASENSTASPSKAKRSSSEALLEPALRWQQCGGSHTAVQCAAHILSVGGEEQMAGEGGDVSVG